MGHEPWHLRLVYNLAVFNSNGHRGDGLDSLEVEGGMWPQRVHGPSFLCSDCFGLARLPTQTDRAVISDFIAVWLFIYTLVFIAP